MQPLPALNTKALIRGMVLLIVLNGIWTYLCIKTNFFTDRDKGLVSGLGYLAIFSSAIHFAARNKSFGRWLLLSLGVIVLFLVSSFILGLLLGTLSDSFWLYAIVNAVFVGWALPWLVRYFYGLWHYRLMWPAVAVAMLGSYAVSRAIEDALFFRFDIHPSITMYLVFHTLLIVPLALNLKTEGTLTPATTT